uniref:Uncharacterized protein n=1 Tax=Triticum urartu TaxID=4572 RepID=A0A8R7TTF7_TRIUA
MMQRDLCCRRTYKKQRLSMGDCRLKRCKCCNFTRGSMLEVVCVGGSRIGTMDWRIVATNLDTPGAGAACC